MNETNENPRSGEAPALDPPLSDEEARVLGCLIEKEGATPENYPLTQNATVTACNQKTSRDPIMALSPGQVGQTLRKLEQRGLVRSEYGARASRYYHRVDSALKLTAAQRTLVGLLLLRGPQTLAELFSRSERLHRFEDIEDVQFNLERLSGREPPLAVRLPRGPGQREDRYMHLLCGPVDVEALRAAAPAARSRSDSSVGDLEARVGELERRLAALEEKLSDPEV